MSQRYEEAMAYLYAQLPMFSRQGAAAIKKDLTNTRILCEWLGDPEQNFKSIHIAGTNGKGSVSHMLAAVFQQAGYKTGLYTSPHLVDFTERIRVNGAPADKDWIADFVARYRGLTDALQPSFFELSVVMAFQYFAETDVDIAIIETGLGGRLDSTNVIHPELSVITNISLDHTDVLGATRAEIAIEKAGIIKAGVPVVVGQEDPETSPIFFAKAVAAQSPIFYAESLFEVVPHANSGSDLNAFHVVDNSSSSIFSVETDLQGAYQKENLRTALAAVEVLKKLGFQLPEQTTLQALTHVRSLTGLRGRWEVWQESPKVIADVAHNPAGVGAAMAQLAQVNARRKHIIIGFVRDKDVAAVLRFFPKNASYYFTQAQVPRAMPVADLQNLALATGLEGVAFERVEEALKAALATASAEDCVFITGSFFIVGEAMQQWEAMQLGKASQPLEQT